MRKGDGIINPALLEAIASLGHYQKLVICDAGLPIPEGPAVIDLSLVPGKPPFKEVLEAVVREFVFEEAIIAEEMPEKSPKLYEQVKHLWEGAKETRVPHEQFKKIVAESQVVVRTGEYTPYANVILVAGVPF